VVVAFNDATYDHSTKRYDVQLQIPMASIQSL
jgi:hypothetical protein